MHLSPNLKQSKITSLLHYYKKKIRSQTESFFELYSANFKLYKMLSCCLSKSLLSLLG